MDGRRESAAGIVERESEPTVHAEAFSSLAAMCLSVGTGACRGAEPVEAWGTTRLYRRVKKILGIERAVEKAAGDEETFIPSRAAR